jgi:hypothetical protein
MSACSRQHTLAEYRCPYTPHAGAVHWVERLVGCVVKLVAIASAVLGGGFALLS